jgi:DNA-directed RNA polymerase subunit RPC12/RpoP
MDINFKCRHCEQELSVDAAGAGSEIQCPACGGSLIIPSADATTLTPHIVNPISTSAAAREGEKHFSVPQYEKAAESLIAKPLRPLEAAAHEGVQLRIKCIRHFDCVEVGKDHFDEVVTNFVNKIGEQSIIKIDTFNYSHRDLETRDWITDYGVFILYKTQ